jgi:glycine cleavage system H lipoate-binding protein
MRYYPSMYKHMWFYHNNNITRIGITNHLKNTLNLLNNNNKKKIVLETKIQDINTKVKTMDIIASIMNNTSKKKYLFHTPHTASIINVNQSIIDCPKLLLTNNERENWVVDIERTYTSNLPYINNRHNNVYKFDYEYYIAYN